MEILDIIEYIFIGIVLILGFSLMIYTIFNDKKN